MKHYYPLTADQIPNKFHARGKQITKAKFNTKVGVLLFPAKSLYTLQALVLG